jgi:Serpentine type 7TM GPCR chemoreceptor Srx
MESFNWTSGHSSLEESAPGKVNATAVMLNTTVDNALVAFISFCVSFICMIVSILVLVFLLKSKRLRQAFCLLCTSLTVADAAVLAIFAFWTSPLFLTQSPLAKSLLGRRLGQLSLIFWYVDEYASVAICVNRYLAVANPITYDHIFTTYRTLLVVVACWTMGLLHGIVFFFDGCDFFVDPSLYAWVYADTECGFYLSFVMDLGLSVVIVVLCLALNLATLYKIRQVGRKIRQSTVAENTQERQRKKKEISFFLQSLINAVMMFTMQVCSIVVSGYVSSSWGIFFTSSFMWTVYHGTFGISALVFDKELRLAILNSICCLGLTLGAVADVSRTNVTRRVR